MDCDYDYDNKPIEFQNLTTPKARKEHKCSDCGGIIRIGERYEYSVMKYDGSICVEKRCADCIFIVHEVGRAFYVDCESRFQPPRGRLSEAWEYTCYDIEVDKHYFELAPIACRIVGMQRAACAARGGNMYWSLPKSLTAEHIKELQLEVAE